MPNIIRVQDKTVSCDGGELEHPKIYLEMSAVSETVCPYCGCKFIYTNTENDSTTQN